jgi:beta-phosphoglucomutase family hydrolase
MTAETRMSTSTLLIPTSVIHAVVFDMDGVVTQTASVHAAAWKSLFDEYLDEAARRAGAAPPDGGTAALGGTYAPFTQADYLRYVDGKPRYDGVRDFLASRGLTLPPGDASDAPGAETVCGLGNRKDGYFRRLVDEHGVEPYPSTVALIGELKRAGVRVAIISASRNTTRILEAAGVRGLFEAQVDGEVAADLGLPGKPDPAVFVEAARRLGVTPARAAVVEDAIAGVEAGRRGGFALVIGVDRGGNREALAAAGADAVVADLAEVVVGA